MAGSFLRLAVGIFAAAGIWLLSAPAAADGTAQDEPVLRDDLLSALTNLGYHRPLAEKAVDSAISFASCGSQKPPVRMPSGAKNMTASESLRCKVAFTACISAKSCDL